MSRHFALDNDPDRAWQSPSQLHESELIRPKMCRQRSTRDAHQRELVGERDIATAFDRSALRAELSSARWLGDARSGLCELRVMRRVLRAQRECELIGTDAGEPLEQLVRRARVM